MSISARLFKWCFLGYIAILPMSGTIALRNLLLVILIITLMANLLRMQRRGIHSWIDAGRQVPLLLSLWVLYLVVFPLLAVQPDVAWKNLKGQWVESVLAWIAGYGAVRLLGRQGPTIWQLGLASAFPLALHLSLCLAAWIGLFGDNYLVIEDFGTAWRALMHEAGSGFGAVLTPRDFPIGFRGVEPMHGNLGYAASQAIVLFGVCFFLAWRERNQKMMYVAMLGIAVCFASILIARSRGAILFSALVLLAVVLSYHFKWVRGKNRNERLRLPTAWLAGAIGLFCVLTLIAYQSVRHDPRWQSMVDKIQIGLMLDEPTDVLCNGVPLAAESDIRSRLQGRSPDYVEDVLGGLKGQDGGRILLMRAGVQLALENPRGIDGSRQAYQKLMEAKCGHVPQLHFAHSHQSWIDLSLALGWAGGGLFAAVLFYFMRDGWLSMSRPGADCWATVMFLLCLFWAVRGLVDSVYREHYLQMQAVLIAYSYWRMKLAKVS